MRASTLILLLLAVGITLLIISSTPTEKEILRKSSIKISRVMGRQLQGFVDKINGVGEFKVEQEGDVFDSKNAIPAKDAKVWV